MTKPVFSIRRGFISLLPNARSSEPRNWRVGIPAEFTAEPQLPLPFRLKSPPLDRVFPGPSLRNSSIGARHHRQGLWEDYIIAYEKNKEQIFNPAVTPKTRLVDSPALKMRVWVQFITTPTADTPGTTLLLHFDNRRYLIGKIAEGTQRAGVQRKVKLAAVKDIFLTGPVNWATHGGILGMILTLADVNSTAREDARALLEEKLKKKGKAVPQPTEAERVWLNIHGGRNLTHTLATARRFVFRKGMPLHTQEFTAKTERQRKNWEPTWTDEQVKVWAMVIKPETKNIRKRSHDEFKGPAPLTSVGGKQETLEEQEDRYDQMRHSVVSDMFDSEWRLDALVKKKLSEVKLPSAIFWRDDKGKIEKYTGPMPGDAAFVSDVEVLVRNPWPGAMVETLPPTTPSEASVCYIFKNYPQRGKFDPVAAKALGVKPGPAFSMLARGVSYTTEDGKVVTPDMVMGATKEGTGFAVIDLPTEAYIQALLDREEWSSLEVMSGIGAVIWILGPNVLHDPRLQKFMAERTDLKHIVSSTDCCPNNIAFESPATSALRLNMIDAERFPIPKFKNELVIKQSENQQRPFENAMAGMTVQLEPKLELEKGSEIQFLSLDHVRGEMASREQEVLELAKVARAQVTSLDYQAELDKNQEDVLNKDAEVITLGTGSSMPSKYRNVSATFLRVPGYGNYLLDCGEGTLGQLKRVFGDETPEILRDLKAIWISHLHADHHLGTASVIKEWADETEAHSLTKDNKLIVASDEGMLNWLEEYSQVENYGYDRIQPLKLGRGTSYSHRFSPEQSKVSGLSSIDACPVKHCLGALAVVFNFPNGFKVAYSGDCRPSKEFATLGEGATLLIHEATFDDELQGDAIAKKHSTTAEALEVGRQMKARRILLTHFSQRYQKIPVMDSSGGKAQVAIVAFDYMRVKIGDFPKLEPFKPALMKLFELKED